MDKIGDEDVQIITANLRLESVRNFDNEAALSATPEQSRDMLKVLKHYIRAIHASDAVNADLKLLLTTCAIEPAVPGSVVGGFPFLLKILQEAHQCTGRDCVLRHQEIFQKKKKQDPKKTSEILVVDRDYKKSVKQPGITVKGNSGSSKAKSKKKASECASKAEKRDVPNYYI